jgi:hypothetical protein
MSKNLANDGGAERHTIRVRLHLRQLLEFGAVDSVPIQTALEMGLLPLLERLARRAHELHDPDLEEVLDILAL